MNAKIETRDIDNMIRKCVVVGVNENGQCSVDIFAEQGLFLSNIFQHKLIHRCH